MREFQFDVANENAGLIICGQCDETKPDCKQCRRRGLSCAYEVRPGSSGASPTSQNSPDDASTPQDLGVSDTELMRHFFAHTVSLEPLQEGFLDANAVRTG